MKKYTPKLFSFTGQNENTSVQTINIWPFIKRHNLNVDIKEQCLSKAEKFHPWFDQDPVITAK